MARVKSVFVCRSCGAKSPKWLGRCPECEEWDSFFEEVETPRAEAPAPLGARPGGEPQRLAEIDTALVERTETGILELDRILGGGLVPGSAVLVGGDPGIGKSTLLLKAADALARKAGPVLYVTGEESLRQTKLRAERLRVDAASIYLLAETQLERLLDVARSLKPVAVVVDSIQTLFRSDLSAAPGSVSQVRECGAALVRFAKESGTAVFLVGHVTKEGVIAGPKVLEHLVDTVLSFEGDHHHAYRILRSTKNRFGATHEIGVFEMSDSGLIEVSNPSLLFLGEERGDAPGSAVAALIEGSRAILVEVQALVADAPGRPPVRRVTGADPYRVALIQAALEARTGVRIGARDVFVNVVGGVEVDEPAADLAIALALAGVVTQRSPGAATAVFGEVGLRGEIRDVSRPEARLAEAARLGFRRVLVPAGFGRSSKGSTGGRPPDLDVVPIHSLSDALARLTGKPVRGASPGARPPVVAAAREAAEPAPGDGEA